MDAKQFLSAMSYLPRGWRLVRTPGLKRFVWMPLGINVAVFAGLGWWLFTLGRNWFQSSTLVERFGDVWLLGSVITALQFIAGFLLFMLLVYALTLLANLIGAPFNGLLAERVEAHLTGRSPSTDPTLTFLIRSIPKTLGAEVRKLTYLVLWMIPLLIAHLVPGLNIVAPFLLFGFGAWMFALEYIDYPMGNHGHLFKSVRQTLRGHRSLALGFGLVVALISAVPIVNLILMPVAVAGATALYVEKIA